MIGLHELKYINKIININIVVHRQNYVTTFIYLKYHIITIPKSYLYCILCFNCIKFIKFDLLSIKTGPYVNILDNNLNVI